MHYYKIGVTENRNQAFGLLTYSSKQKLKTGSIVQVPYGRLQTLGVVFEEEDGNFKPEFAVKQILNLLTVYCLYSATTESRVDNRS